jgi:transcriptional regulator with XRE-family HTH domain
MLEIERLQENIKLIRSCAGWTAATFGERLGISRQAVYNWEHKRYPLTRMNYLAIRKLLDDEITTDLNIVESTRKQHLLGSLLEVLVDNPEKYSKLDIRIVMISADFICRGIMKHPEKRAGSSSWWRFLVSGLAPEMHLSDELLAILNGNVQETGKMNLQLPPSTATPGQQE